VVSKSLIWSARGEGFLSGLEGLLAVVGFEVTVVIVRKKLSVLWYACISDSVSDPIYELPLSLLVGQFEYSLWCQTVVFPVWNKWINGPAPRTSKDSLAVRGGRTKDHFCKSCKSDDIFFFGGGGKGRDGGRLAVSFCVLSTDTGLSLCGRLMSLKTQLANSNFSHYSAAESVCFQGRI